MATSIIQTKKRIASIQSTKKITKAMQLVAIAKLKGQLSRLNGHNQYLEKLDSIVDKLSLSNNDNLNLPYFKKEEINKRLFIVISSDLGLCGSYNYNIYHVVDDLIKKYPNDDFILLGNKAVSHYANSKINVNKEFEGANLNNVNKLATQLKNYCISSYKEDTYQEIHFIYTKYLNSLTFKVEDSLILPIDISVEESKEINEISPIVQPDKKKIMESLIPLYIESKILTNLLNSSVSEHACRRNAMESASDNASELLEKLTLQYNKARQENITNEIIEVVSAFNNI